MDACAAGTARAAHLASALCGVLPLYQRCSFLTAARSQFCSGPFISKLDPAAPVPNTGARPRSGVELVYRLMMASAASSGEGARGDDRFLVVFGATVHLSQTPLVPFTALPVSRPYFAFIPPCRAASRCHLPAPAARHCRSGCGPCECQALGQSPRQSRSLWRRDASLLALGVVYAHLVRVPRRCCQYRIR